MSSLLDQAIKVGKELEQSDSRLQSAKQQLEDVEKALAVRRDELAKLEQEHSQRLQSEQSAWEQTKRVQEADLAKRLADVSSREAATAALPGQLAQLAQDQAAVAKRETEAQRQWQLAKEAESHWQERDKELDAKAEAINALVAKQGVPA